MHRLNEQVPVMCDSRESSFWCVSLICEHSKIKTTLFYIIFFSVVCVKDSV